MDADIAEKYMGEDRKILPKVLQFSSEDRFTKYEICELFAEIMGVPLENMVANTEGNDPKDSVQRPYDCHLSSQALMDLGIGKSFSQAPNAWGWVFSSCTLVAEALQYFLLAYLELCG